LAVFFNLRKSSCILIAIGLWASFVVSAQTFNVNTAEDTVDDSPGNRKCADVKGRCSLRAAIMEANSAADTDVIVLGSATYQLVIPGIDEDGAEKGDLDVIHNLSIQGISLESTTIDGARLDRILHVMNGASVTISNITVQKGFSHGMGAGISVDASILVISNSSITDNESAGLMGQGKGMGGGIAIFNYGELTVMNSKIENNIAKGQGGGISINNDSKAVIENTSVMGNEAMYGGGIQVLQNTDVLIKNSVFYNNHVKGGGGGIVSFTNNNVLRIINSTISGNTSKSLGGGAIIAAPKFSEIVNSTITNNQAVNGGGGLLIGGDLNIRNTIIAGNSDPYSPDCYGVPLNSRGFNLIGISDVNGCRVNAATNDLIGSFSAPLNPQLLPLADNGGPTLTHALWINSPAIDAGSPSTLGSGGNACELKDQRGTLRIGRGACDIGAFEATGGGDVWVSAMNAVDVESGFELMQQVITVGNKGPHKASRLILTINLPIGSENITISGEDWSCTTNANTISCIRNALNTQIESELEMEFSPPIDNKEIIIQGSITTVSDDPITTNNQLELKTIINQIPVVMTKSIVRYKADASSVFIAPKATIVDEDDAFLTGASIQFTKGYQLDGDVLYWNGNASIIVQWQPETATLKLTGEDTLAAYEQALHEIVYENIDLSMDYSGSRNITITVSDNYKDSKPVTVVMILDKGTGLGAISSGEGNILDEINPFESEHALLEDAMKDEANIIPEKISTEASKRWVFWIRVGLAEDEEKTGWMSLDAMIEETKWLDMSNSESHVMSNEMSIAAGAVFFAGFLSLYMKIGSLVGFLFSFPLWTPFDPLPVLMVDKKERKRREKKAKKYDYEIAKSENSVEEIFDNEKI